jgi:hypothetical protein
MDKLNLITMILFGATTVTLFTLYFVFKAKDILGFAILNLLMLILALCR